MTLCEPRNNKKWISFDSTHLLGSKGSWMYLNLTVSFLGESGCGKILWFTRGEGEQWHVSPGEATLPHSCSCAGLKCESFGEGIGIVSSTGTKMGIMHGQPCYPKPGSIFVPQGFGNLNKSHTKKEQICCGCRGLWGGRQIDEWGWYFCGGVWKGRFILAVQGMDKSREKPFPCLPKSLNPLVYYSCDTHWHCW